MPLRTLGYLRVSTSQQAEFGHSLDEQRAKVRAYCALHPERFELVGFEVDEGASGKSLARGGFGRALARVDSGEIQALVVPKLDRLTRSVRDLGALLESHFGEGGCALASVNEHVDTTTASGRLMLNLLTVVAQWEREAISERITNAMAHMKAEGKRVGRIPYGYRLADDGVHLEPSPEEQENIDLIRSKRDAGASLRAIAVELNGEGRDNRGRGWSQGSVRTKLIGR